MIGMNPFGDPQKGQPSYPNALKYFLWELRGRGFSVRGRVEKSDPTVGPNP